MTCPKCGKDSPASWILCEECTPNAVSTKTKKSIKTRRIPQNLQRRKPKKHTFSYIFIVLAMLAAIAGTFYFQFGFYTVPPIDALPAGTTLIVWRGGDTSQPFFNSPDAAMSKMTTQQPISITELMPPNKTILRLPYSEILYLHSPTQEK